MKYAITTCDKCFLGIYKQGELVCKGKNNYHKRCLIKKKEFRKTECICGHKHEKEIICLVSNGRHEICGCVK